MKVELFLTLLSFFSTLTSLIVESIKNIVKSSKFTISYNFIALVVGLLVGTGGNFCYYLITGTSVTYLECIYSALMGLASALCSTVGYDKVKQLIEQMKVW